MTGTESIRMITPQELTGAALDFYQSPKMQKIRDFLEEPDDKDPFISKLFHMAILENNCAAISSLIETGASIRNSTLKNCLPLGQVCRMESNRVAMANFLIEEGLKNGVTAKEILNPDIREKGQETPMDAAVSAGDKELTELFLNHDPTLLDKPGAWGRTPLMNAVYRRNDELALFFIDHGADVKKHTGDLPLMFWAALNPDDKVFKMIVNKINSHNLQNSLLNEDALLVPLGQSFKEGCTINAPHLVERIDEAQEFALNLLKWNGEPTRFYAFWYAVQGGVFSEVQTLVKQYGENPSEEINDLSLLKLAQEAYGATASFFIALSRCRGFGLQPHEQRVLQSRRLIAEFLSDEVINKLKEPVECSQVCSEESEEQKSE